MKTEWLARIANQTESLITIKLSTAKYIKYKQKPPIAGGFCLCGASVVICKLQIDLLNLASLMLQEQRGRRGYRYRGQQLDPNQGGRLCAIGLRTLMRQRFEYGMRMPSILQR